MGVRDLKRLTDTSNLALFVNKIWGHRESQTLDCLEWWFWERVKRQRQGPTRIQGDLDAFSMKYLANPVKFSVYKELDLVFNHNPCAPFQL